MTKFKEKSATITNPNTISKSNRKDTTGQFNGYVGDMLLKTINQIIN